MGGNVHGSTLSQSLHISGRCSRKAKKRNPALYIVTSISAFNKTAGWLLAQTIYIAHWIRRILMREISMDLLEIHLEAREKTWGCHLFRHISRTSRRPKNCKNMAREQKLKGVLVCVLLFSVQRLLLLLLWYHTNHRYITKCPRSKLAGGKWYLRVNSIWRPYLKMIDHLIFLWQRSFLPQTSVTETSLHRWRERETHTEALFQNLVSWLPRQHFKASQTHSWWLLSYFFFFFSSVRFFSITYPSQKRNPRMHCNVLSENKPRWWIKWEKCW